MAPRRPRPSLSNLRVARMGRLRKGALAGTLIQYLITGPDPVYYRWYLFPEVYLNAFLLYLATDSLFQFFAVTQKSSAEAQNVALFFFGFISMFNGVAPTPSAFPVWIRWGIWVSPDAVWKSTSELYYCGDLP